VRQLCTRALCFDRGTLVFDGDVESAVNRYLQINRATGPSIDLTDFESKYGRGEIRVESISMANNDASSFSAPWDQPLQLRVRLTANEPVREASVAIGIQTGDGFPIFTVRTADQPGAEFSLREGQTVEVTGIVHHNLRAGHYNVVVGVHSGNYVYYYNPTAAPLEISEVGQRPYLHRNTGAVNCEASWDVSRDG
jgi:hypothetical protein